MSVKEEPSNGRRGAAKGQATVSREESCSGAWGTRYKEREEEEEK